MIEDATAIIYTARDWAVISGAILGAVLYRILNPRMRGPLEGLRYCVFSAAESLMIAGSVYVLWVYAGGFPQAFNTGVRQFGASMVLAGLIGAGIFTYVRMALYKWFPRVMTNGGDLTPPTGTRLPERKE